MEKVLKIIKINVLSLIALPLLLVATACKLIAKALEKIAVILGMGLATWMLSLLFDFIKNPKEGFQLVMNILVYMLIFGLIILVVYLLVTIAAAVVISVWNAIIGFFNSIYNATYVGFLNLYAICEDDYQYISLNGKKVQNALICLFYTILHGINQVIITVISFALPASYILSALVVIGSVWSINSHMQKVLGLNFFQYLGKLDLFSAIYGVVMLVAILAIFVVVLLSLGIEWHEWAQELRMTSSELSGNIKDLQKSKYKFEKGAEDNGETGNAYMKIVEEHVAGLDTLGNMVEEVLNAKDNALLRSTWGNYFRNLEAIVDECSKHRKGISSEKFRKLIPQIQLLEKQRSEVKEMAEKLMEIQKNPVTASLFFSGCNTEEKLEKRYKSLCKAYHPDAEGGDKETFQKMKDEYENLKRHFAS